MKELKKNRLSTKLKIITIMTKQKSCLAISNLINAKMAPRAPTIIWAVLRAHVRMATREQIVKSVGKLFFFIKSHFIHRKDMMSVISTEKKEHLIVLYLDRRSLVILLLKVICFLN